VIADHAFKLSLTSFYFRTVVLRLWTGELVVLSETRLIYGCSLELNVRQLILTDIAANIGEGRNDADSSVSSAINLVTSKVETRDAATEAQERLFMVSLPALRPWVMYSDTCSQPPGFNATSALQN